MRQQLTACALRQPQCGNIRDRRDPLTVNNMNPHISIDTQRPFERASHLASHTRTCLATFLLLACSLLTITERAAAATLSAPSCSAFDVNETIAIAKTGDTVLVPAGTCTWGAGGNYVSLDKVITLQGAGRGVTIIEMASTAGSWTNGTIRLYWPGTVRGFTIKTSTGASGTAIGAYWTDGFRVTDIEYIDRSSSNSGYFLYTDVYGVVDNNSITGNRGDMEMIFARGPANDPIKSWQTPHSMGGAANLFVENNEFFGLGYVIDCNANSRCVLRYNTIHGPSKIDGHGKASNSPGRGVRHMEIYNNRGRTRAPTGPRSNCEAEGGEFSTMSPVADGSISPNTGRWQPGRTSGASASVQRTIPSMTRSASEVTPRRRRQSPCTCGTTSRTAAHGR
jgi:hypothetical protein